MCRGVLVEDRPASIALDHARYNQPDHHPADHQAGIIPEHRRGCWVVFGLVDQIHRQQIVGPLHGIGPAGFAVMAEPARSEKLRANVIE